MKAFLGISIFSAIAAAALIVSCSPGAKSYERPIPSDESSLAATNERNSEAAAEKFASGDWICAPKSDCTYSKISISAKDGTALLESEIDEDSPNAQGLSAKVAISREPHHLHIELNLMGSQNSLSGDISMKNGSQVLVISAPNGSSQSDERYTRDH